MQLQHLPYTPLRITSGFGPRKTNIAGASTYHLGVDLGTDKSKPYTATDGGPVTAVLPGTVISNYYNVIRGWVLLIDHGTIDGQNIKTLYQHLRQSGRPVGTKVLAGEVIANMGNTGVGAQLHLHFELRVNNTCVDPEPYLKNIKEVKNMGNITLDQAKKIVKEKVGVDDNTIQYLLFYKYGETLIKKIAVAVQ
ncbi:M23 family metallopeptidase [Aminipila butyrica]|uniref:M23 family metallopeptidase n=1 Tax=Aminipila butyrica TaxID=433296 RepID=A0A858BTH9_9FIRM|nr:M23 family metallopeptidase [Aminipila butyrica]QIB68652.1 M23 family metallopeptidase [Aminipila butyrica]